MGVGYLEMRMTPDHVIYNDLDMAGLEAKYGKQEMDN